MGLNPKFNLGRQAGENPKLGLFLAALLGQHFEGDSVEGTAGFEVS